MVSNSKVCPRSALLRLLIGFAALLLGVPAMAGAVITGVDIATDQVIVRFDKPVATASAFVLNGPQRIAIDLPNTRMGRIQASGGLIASTRHGQYDPTTARIVF